MIEHTITTILAFVSTNIDDIFLLTVFFGSRKYSFGTILGGQLIGIFILVAISLLASLIGKLFDPRYIGLMGFFPIYLAIKQIVLLLRSQQESESVTHPDGKGSGVFSISMVTIANGGDNIGVYVPLLATYSAAGTVWLLIIFTFMVIAWCFAASYLSRHPLLSRLLDKYAHVTVPMVLLALGIFILIESRAMTLIL